MNLEQVISAVFSFHKKNELNEHLNLALNLNNFSFKFYFSFIQDKTLHYLTRYDAASLKLANYKS